MKRLFLLTVAALLSLSACSQKATKEENNDKQTKEMKTLVTYFSASGVTKGVAERLASAIGADIMEIVPEQRYTEADLDWRDKNSRSTLEMKDKSSRPAIVKGELNPEDYDVICVGFPIWWYTCPTIINTFMESFDHSGKTIIPFATSGGSTIDKACADLKAAYPKANWKAGKLLNNATEQDLLELVK
ncbi:MAG: NAD(P)H-dependent oxidoreductase [Bacteroidales bacterium]|nr:NAD(P)H-dependent oxidoreductase [Bacteroidales bacterium]